jgi:hypothetical protein
VEFEHWAFAEDVASCFGNMNILGGTCGDKSAGQIKRDFDKRRMEL